MMNIINGIKENYILLISAFSWFSAQVIKTIINVFVTKSFKAERLVGAGGMPSAHSAFVSSIVIATAKTCGLSSNEFALAFALAAVVIYDAMGVRRAAGEQAKTINLLTDALFNKYEENIATTQLKELLGHTPLEVLAGIVLGVSIALIF